MVIRRLVNKNRQNPFIALNLYQDYRCCCRYLIENKFSSFITINNSISCFEINESKNTVRFAH